MPTLKAEIFDSNNQVVYTAGGNSDSVDAGTFTAKATGSYKLVYTAVDAAGNSITDETTILVGAAPTQAAKKAQTVTAKNVTKTYGAKAFKLGAKTDGDGTLTYASGNKKVVTVAADGKVSIKGCGKTTITIKAAETNAYKAATKKITVTVKPKKQKVSSVKSTKAKTITVKWAKDTKATGYVLQYSTDKNFKKGVKTVTISNNKTTSKKISKLKSEKKYYVRVCSYKKASGSKLQGNYSAVKSVTVK